MFILHESEEKGSIIVVIVVIKSYGMVKVIRGILGMNKKYGKKKTQKIMATIIMGINCVNTFAPMGLKISQVAEHLTTKQLHSEQEYNYDVLPIAREQIDNLIFSKAEAREISGMAISGETIVGEDVTVLGAKPQGSYNAIANAENCVIGSGGKVTLGGVLNNAISCTIEDGGKITTTYSFYTLNTENCILVNGSLDINGSSKKDIVNAKGVHNVLGTATNTTVNNDGIQNVASRGISNDGIINGGVQNVFTYGLASGNIIKNNGVQNISSGGRGLKTTIEKGGIQNVASGGTVGGITTIGSGGVQNLSDGAYMNSGNIVIDGGIQNIYGTVRSAYNATISFGINGGTQVLNSGASYTFSTLSGGTQMVMDGAIGGASLISGGGVLDIQSGGTGSVMTVAEGGTVVLNAGANTTVERIMGGTQIVNGVSATVKGNYGTPYGTQIVNTGEGYWFNLAGINAGSQAHQIINGGSGKTDLISSFGTQTVNDGVGSAVFIHNGGTQTVVGGTGYVGTLWGSSGGNAAPRIGGIQEIIAGKGFADLIYSGGVQTIYTGGSGYAGAIQYAGIQEIKGGSGYAAVISGGGAINHYPAQQIVSSGEGTAEVLTNTRAQQIVLSGVGKVITLGQDDNDGHPEQIVSGGTGLVKNIIRGGVQTISAGAVSGYAEIVSGYKVSNIYHGGTQNVNGAVGNVNILKGGLQVISKGGADAGVPEGYVNEITEGGLQNIQDGSGSVYVISSGEQRINKGTGSVDLVKNDGVQTVAAGATGNINILDGGSQNINGIGSAVYILNAGVQNIERAGIGQAEKVFYGGIQNILDGGTGSVSEGVYEGGTQNIESGGSAKATVINGGKQFVNGIADGTVVNDGTQVLLGGSSLNTVVNGGVVEFRDHTTLIKNMTLNGGAMRLGGNATTFALGDDNYEIAGTLTMNGGFIDMVKNSDGNITGTFESLTIEKIAGDKTVFRMDTNLAEGKSDQILINNVDSGSRKQGIIQINNIGDITETGNLKQLLVTDESETLKFTGGFYNAGGLWEVKPTVENGLVLAEAAKEWYLTGVVKKVNNDTLVLLNTNDSNYATWRNTNDSMRKHFGDLRRDNLSNNGIWVRTLQGKFGGEGFDSSYSMYQIGYDKADNTKSIYGFATEYGKGRVNYINGSGEDQLNTFNLYGVWYGDKGTYTNLIGRFGMIDSDINTYGDNPDKASSKSHTYSLSVEYGKTIDLQHGVFVEPQVQMTVGRLGAIDYITDNNHMVKVDGMNSIIGRLGFVLGSKTEDGNDVYFTASCLHEFAGKRDVTMSAGNESLYSQNNYKGTWYEIGIGTNVDLNKTSHFYSELSRSFSGNIVNKWQINVGLRFEF